MPILTTTNSAAANGYGRQIGEHHCLRHSITTATSPLLSPGTGWSVAQSTEKFYAVSHAN